VIESSAALAAGDSDGTNFQVSANFTTQLPTFSNISTDLRYGYEYKNADNTFAFGGTPAAGNETELGQFYAQLVGYRTSAKSRTVFDLGLWASPENTFSNNSDEAFNGTREGAEASYAYVRGGIDHTIFFQNDWRFNIDVEAQYSGDRLITSEQIFIGGFNSVRGFDELFSRSSEKFKDSIRGLAFYDFGSVDVDGVEVAGDDTGTISSVGVGFTYQADKHFTAEGSFGIPINDSGDIGSDDGQFNFRLIARF